MPARTVQRPLSDIHRFSRKRHYKEIIKEATRLRTLCLSKQSKRAGKLGMREMSVVRGDHNWKNYNSENRIGRVASEQMFVCTQDEV